MQSNNRYKISRTIRIAVYFQIVLMIGMTISFAYLLNQESNVINTNEIYVNKKESYTFNEILLKALSIFNKIAFRNNFVSALDTNTCPLDKNGSICQEYTAAECADKCAVACLPTAREQSATCKLGTCYDSFEGTCQFNSPKIECENKAGKWFNEALGNVPECQKGCCVLGSNAYFGTARQCERDTSTLGLKKDFRPEINTEIGCIALSRSQDEGACVFENEFQNTCKYTTKLNCLQNMKGQFYTKTLCSNPDLNTTCVKQKRVSCVEGKDEVYWFDSCGNQENIYEGAGQVQRDHSWNDGEVSSKSESCSLNSGNNLFANQKTCGNCDYFSGSKCGVKTADQFLSGITADAVCKDLNCVDENGKKRKQGESWCVYQGSIGTDKGAGGFLRATDTVGSRDFRKVCIDGEVRTEPCQDYRGEICVESQKKDSGGTYSSSACKRNTANLAKVGCFEYNTKNKTGKCEDNPDCFVKQVNVDKYFKFNVCVPKYPIGFNLQEDPEKLAERCNLGTKKCKVIYVNEPFSGWKCAANCKCETAAFAEQMNDMCISLGDCGTKVNYIGDLTKNHKIYKSGSKKKLGTLFSGKKDISNTYINALIKYADEKLFKGKYATAPSLLIKSNLTADMNSSIGQAYYKSVSILPTSIIAEQTLGDSLGSLSYSFDTGDLSWTFLAMIFGWGSQKSVFYTFQCNPWQAPTGGAKCAQCGADGFPCSKYSCESLGQTCQLINEETGNAECISISPDDITPPVIFPASNLLPSGYSAETNDFGVQVKSSNSDGCIRTAYEIIPFGIKLDEPGQCVMSNNHTASFDEMDQSLSSGIYYRNHSIQLNVNSLDDLGLDSFNPDARAEVNLYVRCLDKNGNKNDKEYVINYCLKPGNDTTPPVVIARNPILETVRFGLTNITASVFTNEPADCKWDTTEKAYSQMKNNFACLNDFEQRDMFTNGWRCISEFPISSNNQSLFYVRCLDQPWENDSTKRNANTQSYQLKFNKVANPLKIDSINVDNQTLVFGTKEGSMEVIAKTSGGLDGTAVCGYKLGNSTIEFYDTSAREHKQVFPVSTNGDDSLTIVCEDLIGNTAEKTANFKIKIDLEAPRVTRVYAQSGALTLITDEDATCYYNLNRQEQCSFDIENASMMNGEDVKAHSILFDAHSSYYIKCKDKFGHYPGACSIVVREGTYETQEL